MQSLRERLILLGGTGAILSSALLIGPAEGLRQVPYTDIGGVKTWCYGQTVGHPKARYTVQECDAELLRTVAMYHKGVMLHVPADAPASVQAAITSLAYNVGLKGWQHPVLLEPLKKRDWEAVCAALEAPWKGRYGVAKGFKATVNGKPVRGLENRRAQEAAVCRQDLR